MLAATILWKLSEYEDFVLPLLRADAAGKCAAVIEELGPPRAGPLQYWLQVSVQVGNLPDRLFSDACREHGVLLFTLAFGSGGWCPYCRSCCCSIPQFETIIKSAQHVKFLPNKSSWRRRKVHKRPNT